MLWSAVACYCVGQKQAFAFHNKTNTANIHPLLLYLTIVGATLAVAQNNRAGARPAPTLILYK